MFSTRFTASDPQTPPRPFRRAVYRGLSLVTPPLVTIALLMWMAAAVRELFLEPMTRAVRAGLVWQVSDVRQGLADLNPTTPEIETRDGVFVRVGAKDYVPLEIAQTVRLIDGEQLPSTGRAVFERYIEIRYLRLPILLPVFLLLLVLVLYLVGKFLAVGIGRLVIDFIEQALRRVPLVRSLYPAVKQVTLLLLSQRESGYTRIVAVEFPSPGSWAIAFVTGESLPQIRAAAGEPVVSLHVPYPPVLKGSLITVRKSQTIDLAMTVDQAIQYVVSCGVLQPHRLKAITPVAPRRERASD